jgi:vacuolar-type H+-ATPase subunit E/Vma4
MISEAKNRESDADDQSVVLEDANREANEIKRAALKYADNLLASVQESIEKTLNIIASNREELDQ